MLFDYKKLEVKSEELEVPMSPFLYVKHLEFSYATIKNIEKDIIIPAIGGIVFMQTDIAFNAFDLVVCMASKFNIKHLYSSTYSISRKSISSIIHLHDCGKIEQLTLLISDSMIKRNPGTIDNLMAMTSSRPNLKVLFAWSHAKVNLLETHNGDYFVLEGSGNWSENAHYEQYILVNSKEPFDYRKQLFDNCKLKKYEI